MDSEHKSQPLAENDPGPELDGASLSGTPDFTVSDLEAEPPEPYSALVSVDFEAMTHAGRVRKRNEDTYLVYCASRSWARLQTSLPEHDLPSPYSGTGRGARRAIRLLNAFVETHLMACRLLFLWAARYAAYVSLTPVADSGWAAGAFALDAGPASPAAPNVLIALIDEVQIELK